MIPFDEERPISSLPIYPMQFHEEITDQPTMRERLVARGCLSTSDVHAKRASF